jgi:hypothetical protein
MGFFQNSRLKASDLVQQAVEYLVIKYEQAASVFTPASPFGQLLVVISNIAELIFTYISHTAEELNIRTAQNIESIHGLAQLAGHDVYRGGAAYGVMGIKLNTVNDFEGNHLKIKNFSKFTINETGCMYFMNLPTDSIKITVGGNSFVSVPFMQGEIETQTFTSNGTPLQSFNPVIKGMTDHDNIAVRVNGKEWKKVDSLYDMPSYDDMNPEVSECFIVKTSPTIGISIFFGNDSFGQIPPSGALIEVVYIKTSGVIGNSNSTGLTYRFIDMGIDEYGNEVDLNEVLIIETIAPPMLGADYENPEFTKVIAPKASKSFVLATPENYVNFLSKYNQYSYIYAYHTKNDDEGDITDDNVIYLKVIPDIKKKLSSSEDYFEVPVSEFVLDKYEKESLMAAILNSGRMLIGTEVEIVDPKIKYFTINIVLRYFENFDRSSISSNIRSMLNKYFLNIGRSDIIPKSDLVALIESIEGIDTCDVFFVSKENEMAKKNGYYYDDYGGMIPVGASEDPRVGFDQYGNIVMDRGCVYIPRGGWRDANDNYYTLTPEDGKLGPLNIFFHTPVKNSTYNIEMQRKLNNLLK